MKKIFNKKWLVTLMMGAAMLGACTDNALVEAPEVMQEENKDTYVATITAKLPDTAAGSRLAYENGTHNGKHAILTKWEKGDLLVANPNPSSEQLAYSFSLKEGEGTVNGEFECTNFSNGNSNAWTIYYPGSKIQSDADYLSWSYTGQTQKGNDNMGHLKDKHSMRITYYTDPNLQQSRPFEHAMIDFSAEGVDQSSCMKFNLSGFSTSITPNKLELVYYNPQGGIEPLFYEFNLPSLTFSDYSTKKLSRMTLNLSGFSATKSITAYMMMSNATMSVSSGGKFRVYVTTTAGARYYGDVAIKENVDLKGGNIYSITCKSWKEMDQNDAFVNPDEGIVVLQEATKGNPGVDIVIMGDGFGKDHFGTDGGYETIMENAYEDFFSVEPYNSLREYFNVYYINAVSEDDHDAVPYYDDYNNQNGATNGNANTVFSTKFTPNDTSIEGNNDAVLEYARQAIRSKGGANGTAVSDENEVNTRVDKSLMIVMVNVACYAGTCSISWDPLSTEDYCKVYSIGYTSLGNDGTGVQCKWTNLHENAGHGFGKLADEYQYEPHNGFNTSDWNNLSQKHKWGLFRNVNEYWCEKYVTTFNSNLGGKEYTSKDNVYWSALLNSEYGYNETLSNEGKGEGLDLYEGANTKADLYCRPTDNSIMNSQMAENGQFFNAISRWSIWYRVMRLTNSISETTFASSLDKFIAFEKRSGYIVKKNVNLEGRGALRIQDYKPLAPPVLIEGQWINDRFVRTK